MLTIKDLWWNKKTNKGYAECAAFLNMVRQLPKEVRDRFYHPNKAAAPWHVQARVGGTVYNVWPHKCKWQEESTKAQYGWGKLSDALMEQATKDTNDAL